MSDRTPTLLPNSSVEVPSNLATGTDLDRVIKAFLDAPVNNPDNSTGIRLHIKLDEQNIARQSWGYDPWSKFYRFKTAHFGSVAERNSNNKKNILAAKKKVYRYAVFADYFYAVSNNKITDNVSGAAEKNGSSFWISLGRWSIPGGTTEQQIGTFMHELGHSLGLEHGGGDKIKYKPNYRSVMNYTWQIPQTSESLGGVTTPLAKKVVDSWKLDYSDRVLEFLDEANLNERVGIGGNPDYVVPVGLVANSDKKPRLIASESGAVDFNGNGIIDTLPVKADINWLAAGKQPSDRDFQPDSLEGYNDWANLRFGFRDNTDYVDGVVETNESEELSFDEFEQMSASLRQLLEETAHSQIFSTENPLTTVKTKDQSFTYQYLLLISIFTSFILIGQRQISRSRVRN